MSRSEASRPSLAFLVALVVATALFAYLITQANLIASGGAISFALPWVPQLDLDLAFHIDGLAYLFGILITGIGVLVVLYTSAYFRGHRDEHRLQWLLLAFMLAMLGLVSADHVILLFVFWELTTVTSFLLVGFDHENAKARAAALQALLVTGVGGLALLAGLILLAEVAGSYYLTEIIASAPTLAEHDLYGIMLVLILLGAFTKSAQFPFHFWLPNAMAAPSPVSAYLHSATMVKAGIYLLARLQPPLGGTDAWFYTLTTAGAITAVWGSLMALRQTDLKLMLAWTTVMGLGTLTLFLGSDIRIAALAAITFLLVHALYKCALFLVIGNVDHGSGTREIDRLGGLARAMPVSAVIAVLAGFSMAGFPPFLGFIGKELKYEGALALSEEPFLIATAALSANAMMVAVALMIVFRVFLGGRADTPRTPHEASLAMWIGPLLLAVAGLLSGIFPELISKVLIEPATSDVLAEVTEVKLSLWHGVNVPLMMSIATVLIGVILFWQARRVRDAINRMVEALPITGDRAYQWCLDGIQQLANAFTNRFQNGSLSWYLTALFCVFVASMLIALLGYGVSFQLDTLTPIPPLAGVVVLLMIAATLAVIISRSRLLAICALGIVGSGVGVLFLLFGAIDVAITQLMVETLFVVLIATVFLRLPNFRGMAHPGTAGSLRDGIIAVGAGLVMGLITLAVATTPLDMSITRFFEQASLPDAYGRNIVNVILVDFRALDTLGEVAVVATAALAVIALLKTRPRPAVTRETP